jgi:hypothetical protein
MLTITIYPDAETVMSDEGGVIFEDYDYVSLVNNETYGPPALIAPPPRAPHGAAPRASIGDKVLYINTNLVPVFEIVRTDD